MSALRGDYSPLPATYDDSAPTPRVHSPADDHFDPASHLGQTELDGLDVDALDKGEVDESAVIVPGEDE